MADTKLYGINRLRETLVVKESVRRSMQGNTSRDTSPEVRLRQALWQAGFRGYRKHYRRWPGKPDVAFVGRHVAVFVHGCFWHGCPECTQGRLPATNTEFWRAKIERNRQRDATALEALSVAGVARVVLWECEVRRDLTSCVAKVAQALAVSSECASKT
ncbi:MAG: very short patch repair endonuclease [Fimbriimonadaceae bacterium]